MYCYYNVSIATNCYTLNNRYKDLIGDLTIFINYCSFNWWISTLYTSFDV